MKKSFLIGLLAIVSSISFAQKSINSYKYIIVPNQFEFQKSNDSYQLNSLTKFLFEREGFIALFENEQFPKDLALNRCLGLRVDLKNNSSLLSTKMKMDLKDCNNTVVFSSKEVKSKSKDYKKAYQEAIRMAFVDVEELNYAYNANLNEENNDVVKKNEVLNSEEEIITVKEEISDVVLEVEELQEVKKVVNPKLDEEIERREFMTLEYNLEGTYTFENWGKSVISKNEDEYSVVGGDENFEFATIYKTSKPTLFIIKWVAFKQPQLLEINSNGNLSVDTSNGVKTFYRIN